MIERKAKLIQKIHIGKAQLHMAEEAYHAMLRRYGATGAPPSSRELEVSALEGVYAELKAKGFRARPPKGEPPGRSRQATGGEISKARAVWLFLGEAGVVRDASEAAFVAYVKRQTRVEDPAWVPGWQMGRLIESLKKWAERTVPAQLARRHAAAILEGRVLYGQLQPFIVAVSPTLDPATYDAIHAAWEALDAN
jgi:phage gp16-like protein